MYTNADSLLNKRTELTSLIDNYNHRPDVIAIVEVKPKNKSNLNLSEFSIPGYAMFSNIDVKNTTGIIIYVDKTLTSNGLDLNNNFRESVIIKIKSADIPGEYLLFCCIYRSPKSDDINDDSLFCLIDELTIHHKSNLVIVGDFNLPNINWGTKTAAGSYETKFLEKLDDHFLIQHVHEPTRARGNNSPHVLDLVLTCNTDIDDLDYLSPLGNSGHCIVEINLATVTDKRQGDVSKYNYSKGAYPEFRDNLDTIDWDGLFEEKLENVEQLWGVFLEAVNDGVSRFVPMVGQFSGCGQKWKRPLAHEIRNEIKSKHRAWNTYMKSKIPDDLKIYKRIRNRVKSLIKQRDKKENCDIAISCKANPKKFWNYINSKTKNANTIPDLEYTDNSGQMVYCESSIDKADALNKFFSSVFNQNTDYEITEDLQIEVLNSMEPLSINQDDVLKRLQKLNVNKSAGNDKLHPRILKELAHKISYPLSVIFNQSLTHGVLPEDWRRANITPIHKKGKKKVVANYRPIRITSVACKLFESVVRDHIMKHFLSNNLLSTKQYGFIPGRSTVIQLLKMLDDWTSKLENGGQIDVIYTDLEKAFDKVPHKYLIYKLKQYKVDPKVTRWIESFLLDRQQRVVIDGTASEYIKVISGIPQGSVLGPVLFIIYINDLVEYCEVDSSIFLYADDAKLYRFITCEQERMALQKDLHAIVDGINKYMLKLNEQKCKVVSYGRNIDNSFTYSINGNVLESLNCFKDLGVTFDSKLKFGLHINEKVNKANSILGIIKRNFLNLSEHAFLCLYKSMVRSHLEYAEPVWSPHYQEYIEKIERVQMRATKLLPGLKNKPYSARLKCLKLPTLKFRRVRGDLIELYKMITNIYDKDISLYIKFAPCTVTNSKKIFV